MRSKCTTAVAMLAAVFAFSAVAVASASAHEFIASTTGAFTSKNVATIDLEEKAGINTCSKSTGSGTIKALKSGAIVETLILKGCEMYPFAIESVTPAEFEYTAEGKARLMNKVTMEAPLAGCDWVWLPSKLETSTVTYKNSSPTKTIEAHRVTTLTLDPSGGLCGIEDTNAKWIETSVFSPPTGGTLKWE